MVRLRLKVGEKGHILIPKLFRERYGIKKGDEIAMEPTEAGILLKGRATREEFLSLLEEHRSKLKAHKIRGSTFGDLRGTYQEREYEDAQ